MIRQEWNRLEEYLKQNNPAALKSLNPPATDKQIKEVESHLGLKLPLPLVEFLKVHNGENPTKETEYETIYHRATLLSTDEIIGEWGSWKDLTADGEFAEDDQRVKPDHGVKKMWWNKGWVPISANGSGDSMCVDMDPDAGGTKGQVIQMWHDDPTREILGSNFLEWFKKFVDEIIVYTEKSIREKENKKQPEKKKPWWSVW